MAQQIVCDQCGKTETEGTGLLGWWEIAPVGEYLRRFGDREPPYQFCSWRCVEQYARALAAD